MLLYQLVLLQNVCNSANDDTNCGKFISPARFIEQALCKIQNENCSDIGMGQQDEKYHQKVDRDYLDKNPYLEIVYSTSDAIYE